MPRTMIFSIKFEPTTRSFFPSFGGKEHELERQPIGNTPADEEGGSHEIGAPQTNTADFCSMGACDLRLRSNKPQMKLKLGGLNASPFMMAAHRSLGEFDRYPAV